MSNEVVRWEPFNERVSLRDAVNRLFEDSFIQPGAWPRPFDGGDFSVPADVVETKDNVVVKLSAPGVCTQTLRVSVSSGPGSHARLSGGVGAAPADTFCVHTAGRQAGRYRYLGGRRRAHHQR